MIYLTIKNIIIKRFNTKLDYKYLGLYKVIKKFLKNNYQSNLPLKVRIYLIFFIFLLKEVINVKFINIERNNVKVKKKEYEVKKGLDIRNY